MEAAAGAARPHGSASAVWTLNTSEFEFDLPAELIAQDPSVERGGSRLMVLDRRGGAITHAMFSELPELLRPGDLLVLNNTRVYPARLLGRRVPSGGAVECLLIRPRPELQIGPPEFGCVGSADAPRSEVEAGRARRLRA